MLSVLALMPLAAQSQVYPPGFNDELVVGGFDEPTTFLFVPDGRVLVGEQDGTIWVVENGVVLGAPLTQLDANTSLEQGLLGMALHPTFPNPPELFVCYSVDIGASDDMNRISKLTLDGNTATSEEVLFQDIPLGKHYHVGGCLRFGLDNKLYVSMGDGGNRDRSQDLGTLEGTLMRLNIDGSVPDDNPWVGVNGVRPEIYQYGLRNPFRFSIQPGTGAIFIGDVGFEDWEEVDVGPAMANFGWPDHEGLTDPADPAYTDPIYAYNHSEGSASITGNTFYTGNAFPPEYANNFFFFDHSSGYLGRMVLDGNNDVVSVEMPWIETLADGWGNGPTELREAADGALYYTTYSPGTLRRIYYDNPFSTAPTAVAAAGPTAGYAPLQVQFDGSGSFDVDGDSLTYRWDFGDASVAGVGINPVHIYSEDGQYDVVLTVDDGQGNMHSAPALRITVGSLPPMVTILSPVVGSYFLSDQETTFHGFATDADDGLLPDSLLHWQVFLHHLNHIHPVILDDVGGMGSFIASDHGENPADVFYRVTGWTVDSSGIRGEAFVDVFPDPSLLQGQVPGITSTPQTVAMVGAVYNYPAQATGAGPIIWSLPIAPGWLGVESQTGLVSGTPPGPGTYNLLLRAQNHSGMEDQSWNLVVADIGGNTTTIVPIGATWYYFKGLQDPGVTWKQIDHDDSAWLQGQSGFGYGDFDDATVLADMEDNYTTVFTRYTFQVPYPASVTSFAMLYDYDDGIAVYLNGTMLFSADAPDSITYQSTATTSHEASGSLTRIVFNTQSMLALIQEGDNCLAAVGLNTKLSSGDLTLQVAFEITGGLQRTTTGVDELATGRWALPATPNPFGKRTVVQFSLGSPGPVQFAVYDVAGRLVKSITTPRLTAGTHSVSWDGAASDGSQVPAGIYFYRLNVRDVTTRGKLLHLR